MAPANTSAGSTFPTTIASICWNDSGIVLFRLGFPSKLNRDVF